MAALTQAQSEALVRLMILAKYQDQHISVLEDARFQERLGQLPWDAPTSIGLFVDGETAAVRRALETPEGRAELLRAQCVRFDTAESQRYLLSQIQRVLDSDTLSPEEQEFVDRLKSAFP